MRHGTLLSFAILALLAASPAGATPTGLAMGPPEQAEPSHAPAAPAAVPSTREGGGEGRLYRVASETTEDQPEQSAAVMVDDGQALDAAPARPMIIAVAGGGAAGHPAPLGITVVPAPYPPAHAVSVVISGLPPGSMLSRGKNHGAGIWHIGLKNADGLWSAGLMDLDDLSLIAPPDYIGTVDLKVTALAMHNGIGMESDTQSLSVTFDPPPAGDAALAEATEPMAREEPGAATPAPLPAEAPRTETMEPSNPAETGRAGGVSAAIPEIPLVQRASPVPAAAGAMKPGDEQEAGLIDEPNTDGEDGNAPAAPIPVRGAVDETGDAADRAAMPGAAPPPSAAPPAKASRQEEQYGPAPALTADSAEKTVVARATVRLAPGKTQTAALADVEPAPAPTRPDTPVAAKTGAPAATAPTGSAAALPEELVMRRGDALFAQGDLAGARLFYESGLAAGSSRAAFALGKTYDPLVHRQLGVRGFPPDPAKALDWYRTAMAAGNMEAERWLQDLTAWLDHGR